jgi:cell division protease FtsH
LNALLVEMDGFDTQEGIVLMAATNRPDVLDPALLRPGRFDRQVVIDPPDLNGREAILKVHTRKIKLAKEVDLKAIARQTPGFSGADLANLANEAALLAARWNKDGVGMEELEIAIERVIAGPERKSRVINEREKKITAYHESGHALVASLIPNTDPLHKVSIIPRGAQALGYTMQLPLEDRYTLTKQELLARLTVMMGGRAAEELAFSEVTTGAQNDLESATEIARRMVCEFGMSERLGALTYGKRERQIFLGRDLFEERNYSEQTAVLIDEEIRRIVDGCYERAKHELVTHRAKLEALATALLEKEVLDGEEVKQILGLQPAAAQPSDNDRPTPAAS